MANLKTIIQTASVMALIGVSPALAANYINRLVPNAQKVGTARMQYMIWDIYDAALYAPDGKWSSNRPYALQLKYLKNLSGEKIADRSIKEMRGQGFYDDNRLAVWHEQMKAIFPDVQEGDVLIGIYTQEAETVFFDAEKEIGRIIDPEFGKRFFGIWLNEATSEPDIRMGLLGNEYNNDNERAQYDVQNYENTIGYRSARRDD